MRQSDAENMAFDAKNEGFEQGKQAAYREIVTMLAVYDDSELQEMASLFAQDYSRLSSRVKACQLVYKLRFSQDLVLTKKER